MPQLPIDVLEIIVDSSAGYKRLLCAFSLTSRVLTARTRVHLFHAIYLGTPNGPNKESPSARYGKVIPTRCDAFLSLCAENPNLALHVRELVITESVWHPTTGQRWSNRSQSLVPVVRSLLNLKRFAFRTEGLNVQLSVPLKEILSVILAKADMEWISMSDIQFGHASNLFSLFTNAGPQLQVLNLADIAIYLNNPVVEDISGYIPVRIDTLAVSFDIQHVMEEPIIRIALQRSCPLFDMRSLRCLQLQVYHGPQDIDRVHAWLSMGRSVEELNIHIVPGNKALRWRQRRMWRHWITEHFDCSKRIEMPCLQKISFKMKDHYGIGIVAAIMEFVALAQSLTHVTIQFTSSRGPLSVLDEHAWRQVDMAFSRATVFPQLSSIEILFDKNSHVILDLDRGLSGIMINTVDILRITETC
ncbi:hypothetical protein C8R43DRAFT_1243604 [Mycena crocata]|nr:hypothetical protein C8R43DRAFT_1243604 [Mycena crocata]